MKTPQSNVTYLILLTFIFILCLPFTNYAQLGKANFGGLAGLYFEQIEVISTDAPGTSTKKNPPGFFGTMRVNFPISKRVENLRLQFDLSYRGRSFDTSNDLIGSVKVSEREMQLEPIISRVLPVGDIWSPIIKGGFNVNFAFERKMTTREMMPMVTYEWTKFNDLFTANLVLGFGVIHKKSGFFSEITGTYKFVKPGENPDRNENQDNISVNWFPMAFNIGVGFMFGQGNSN